jgi:serine/threonine-protein kinase
MYGQFPGYVSPGRGDKGAMQQAAVPYERLIGRYALYGEIASGGMATVHFGRLLGPVGFSRTVAIKRLHAQFAKDPEFVAMFLDEARLAGRIQHPNVVATLDVVALEGELFLVMEYVQGESLAKLLGTMHKRGGSIPYKIVASIIAGVLYGLHAAHEATDERGQPLSIVHRDVSPQNVLVGVDGVARVLDFGVAKAAGRMQATREGEIKGKLAYMPPEQMKGASMDRRTDVYAAAVVFWEALTARRLFDGEHAGVIFTKVMNGEVERPSRIIPGVPPIVDEIILRGLDRDLGRRYATARDMAMDIEDRIGVASPRQVAEWLEKVAGDALSRRAVRVKQIESLSTPPPMQLEALASMSAPGYGAGGAAPGQGAGGAAPGYGAGASGYGYGAGAPGQGYGAGGPGSAPQAPPGMFAPPPPPASDSARSFPSSPGSAQAFPPAPGSGRAFAPEPAPVSGVSPSQVSSITATAPSMIGAARPAARGLWIALGGAGIVILGLVGVIVFSRGEPAAASSSISPEGSAAPSASGAAASVATQAASAAPGAASADPTASAEPSAAPSAVAASSGPASSAASSATSSAGASSPGPTATSRPTGGAPKGTGGSGAPARAGCVPPYTIDASGIRRIKPECL